MSWNPNSQPRRRESTDRSRQRGSPYAVEPLFDPQKPQVALVNELAEKQAQVIREINSHQLRRFFGEVKELYRRLETVRGIDYRKSIEPQFKMLRSKAYYASRSGSSQQRIKQTFLKFIENAVQRVNSEEEFRLFVQHFEAVV
ncbi:MAG: type III-A CRISPR-associated protein Csm2, partial [Planctomycetes bacterium]|nr:type III-A CRISPR-associated protein Csm2 [Planctomycetota bacterium]